jgi:predicted MFS family arabinose efflux permease
MRIPRLISVLFSSASERAASTDAAIVVCTILSIALTRNLLNLQSMAVALFMGTPAWALSMIAIRLSNAPRLSRRPPKRRSKTLTTLTVMTVLVAVAATTWIGAALTSMIALHGISWSQVIETLCFFGPLGIPAAFRLTSSSAFVRVPPPEAAPEKSDSGSGETREAA